MNYEIYVDVAVDIDKDFAKENDVKYIPMEYVLGEKINHCLEPESDEMMHEYYDKLRNKVETATSQISPYHYIDVFEPLVKEGKSVLYISLSSGLSSTYSSANVAVNMLMGDYEEVNIQVIDSLGAAGGMGILVESACKNKNNGMSLEENAKWLREHASNINYWFKVEDLMYLMRGGRVSAASAVVGTALNIKPILIINTEGKLDNVAKKRGNKQAVKYMLKQFEETYQPEIDNTVYICCADCMDEAEKLKKQILDIFPEAKVKLTMLSPIIGAHTGPDLVSIIYYGKKRSL